jgi:hypothetical protein
VRGMNLNTVRLEGKFENDTFFDSADELVCFCARLTLYRVW